MCGVPVGGVAGWGKERGENMDKSIEKRLDELVEEIGSIPAPQREKLIMLARQTDRCHKKLGKSINNLKESLDYLRLSVKYLIFDLEATRRENAALRKLLEDGKKG